MLFFISKLKLGNWLAQPCSCKSLGLLLHLEHMLHLLGAGGLFVLQQVGVALSHTPALGRGQRWALGTPRGG